jgi:hypothetical protein
MTAREDIVPGLSMELSSEFRQIYYIANPGRKYGRELLSGADA